MEKPCILLILFSPLPPRAYVPPSPSPERGMVTGQEAALHQRGDNLELPAFPSFQSQGEGDESGNG